MNTVIYALMHFLVDLVCAFSMFRLFRQQDVNLLIYNFCAFALQMPLGTMLDLLRSGVKEKLRRTLPGIWAVAGAGLTLVGALVHPALLGLGNALFHVGGGMDVIEEDFAKDRKGRNLGVFVAPGAVGLYLGTQLGTAAATAVVLLSSGTVLALLACLLRRKEQVQPVCLEAPAPKGILPLCICCFAVVILRSWVGMSVSFPWKTGALYGWLAVTAVAAGKMAGGFLAARFGMGRTMTATLLLAAVCFALGDHTVWGLAALLLFNMSMPVTLYLLARHLPGYPGFSFGLLTFGLFLGFLPVYAGITASGAVLGAAGSVVSALLLAAGRKAVSRHGIPA